MQSRTAFETANAVVEAPNWSPDGRWLVVNSDGLMYRIPAAGGEPETIDSTPVADSNNDHVLSHDGRFLYVSSQDGHLYEVQLTGAGTRRVTDAADGLNARYLHGISPDGGSLSFIGSQGADDARTFNVFTQQLSGGPVNQLTASRRPHDGAEFSRDGAWLYLNSERASTRAGHAQLFRMRPNGTEISQLTFDERVNWFPHPSPDGRRLVYVSYEPGVLGHPPNHPVQIRMSDMRGRDPLVLASVFGGQGTMNVNSWAPDSERFAYVDYPVEDRSIQDR